MEILNVEKILIVLALSVIVQYLVDKVKYLVPDLEDKLYSVLIAALAFLVSLVVVLAYEVELFTSNYDFVNYFLTAALIAGGSSGINLVLGKIKGVTGGNE